MRTDPSRPRPRCPAYDGDEPYVFVSYAHAERDAVFEELEWLYAAGVRLWHDEGINPGDAWETVITERQNGAFAMLLFLTPFSFGREEVQIEIRIAREHHKKIIVVALEEVTNDDVADEHMREFVKLKKLHWVKKCDYKEKDELAAYRDALGRGLPPEVRGARPLQTDPPPAPSPDTGARLVVRRCLVVRGPGASAWASIEDGATAAIGSDFRVLVQPEQDCYGALIIESLDRQGTPIDVRVLGLSTPEAEATRLDPAVWHVIPPPGSVLREDRPDCVHAWRIGLVVAGDPGHRVLEAVRQLVAAPRSSTPRGLGPSFDASRPLVLPEVAGLAYDIPADTRARALAGSGAIIDWIEVSFVPPTARPTG